MPLTAKVFKTGRSQAVRLPKEFRFNGTEVYIKKDENRVILSEKPLETWAELFKNFSGDPDFSVNRDLLVNKPRQVKI